MRTALTETSLQNQTHQFEIDLEYGLGHTGAPPLGGHEWPAANCRQHASDYQAMGTPVSLTVLSVVVAGVTQALRHKGSSSLCDRKNRN